ncbi:hypothetical protein ACRDNQ_16750 [Palleronia sp. KMU-117]|uniref:hypothetical protein n=1 Tax=Palleronia sp. KMU-117 TaxID=3434108 RepID=UPI003D740036
MTGARQDYFDRLTLAYEEEIETEAYFATLAELFDDPHRQDRLRLLAEIERHTARIIAPLLRRHGLVPRDDDSLVARGQAQARREAPDWDRLLAGMCRTYPGYVAYFERVAADGPEADRPRLACLPEHERAALEFLHRETAGHADSAEPLRRYLDRPVPTDARMDGA